MTRIAAPTVIDFETKGIEGRPHYPPEPVGVSIMLPGKSPKYLAWGHKYGDNNCTKADAARALKECYKASHKSPLLFHNEKFDLDVAEVHFGLKLPPWHDRHDTFYLLFLDDPHADSLALKPSAERLLGEAPDERDAVKDWIIANIPAAKKKPSTWGAYIWEAPAKLVGPYANGDTSRTLKLYKLLYPRILEAGMGDAYDRERRLMPYLLENERTGIKTDVKGLQRDIPQWEGQIKAAERWLEKRLKVKDINWDADVEVANALENAGVVTEWNYTAPTKLHPGGQRSVSKKNLTLDMYNDARVAAALGYRNRLMLCMNTFAAPWLAQAEQNEGYIRTSWNQVRQTGAGGNTGTRTGRPSTRNPNFLNVSKTWYDKDDGYVHPAFLKLPELPLMRSYLTADPGGVFLHRDYSQQELRALAHFEDGALLAAYQKNPRMDVHNYIAGEVTRIRGREIARRPVKITVFRKIYGGGVGATAAALQCSMDEARDIINSISAAIPGLKSLEETIKELSRNGQPIVTWGGRLYYTEPPMFVKKHGRVMTFDYKLLNYLIQGTAADMTKEAVIRYHEHPRKRGRFLVTVYDECNVNAPKAIYKEEMAVLRETMESIEADVPMLTDGKYGSTWGALKPFKEK